MPQKSMSGQREINDYDEEEKNTRKNEGKKDNNK